MQAASHPISSGSGFFRSVCLTTFCLFVLPAAWAGRPLGTDDTGTVGLRTCQLESWVNGGPGPADSLVVAPGCGLAEDLELGFDYTHPRQRGTLRGAAGAALKWAPSAWAQDTRAGRLSFGLKFNLAVERPSDAGWRTSQTNLLALMTLEPGGDWALHANLGLARENLGGETAGLLNLALVWTPQPRWLLFAETQTNNRQDLFGATLNSAGARWWLVKDRLGLDLTASRSIDAGTNTQWSVGFGWYGLGW